MVDEANIVVLIVAGSLVVFLLIATIVVFTATYNKMLVNKENRFNLAVKKQQVELLKVAVDTQEAEREKIALDLHDEVGPLLSSMKFKLAKYKRDFIAGKLTEESFNEDGEFIDTIIQNVRGVSHDLSPQHIIKFGLYRALESFTSTIKDIDFMVVSELDEDERLNKTISRNLYCISMELINNIIKHDTATWMEIELYEEDSAIRIKINHDGKGITNEQFEEFESKSTGLGLTSIKSRLVLLDGSLVFGHNKNMASTEIIVPF